ncbi:MAG: hypothetical protein J0M18_06530 [Ignavibacteria bacterium]|nr:hypothetical protein [Ignavibacteria bacterium]
MKDNNSKSNGTICLDEVNSSDNKDESNLVNRKTEIIKFKKPTKNEKDNKKSNSKDVGKTDLSNNRSTSGAWESGIKILESVKVIIPLKLLLICNQIADRLTGEEFSILVNLTEKDNIVRLSEEFYIPQQVVSSTSIDYIPEDYNFNTVIHRHPDGLNSFSSTDKNFINQNFKLSVLYTRKDGFVGGVYNLKHSESIIQLPIEIVVDTGLEQIDISKINTVRDNFFKSSSRTSRRVLLNERNDSKGNGKAYGTSDIRETDMFTESLSRRADKDDELPFGMHVDSSRERTNRSMFDLEKEDREKANKIFEKLSEENLDYNLLKRILLEEVNDNIYELEGRISEMEGAMYYGNPYL